MIQWIEPHRLTCIKSPFSLIKYVTKIKNIPLLLTDTLVLVSTMLDVLAHILDFASLFSITIVKFSRQLFMNITTDAKKITRLSVSWVASSMYLLHLE